MTAGFGTTRVHETMTQLIILAFRVACMATLLLALLVQSHPV